MFRPAFVFLLLPFSVSVASGADDVFLLEKPGLTALVTDTPAATKVDGYFSPAQPPGDGAFTQINELNKAKVAAFLARKPEKPPVTLSIEWLNQNPVPETVFQSGDGEETAGSSFRMGQTHLSRTFVSNGDTIILHFLADKPGDLSFRVRLNPPDGKGKTVIENRREIAWSSPGENSPLARVWIIPFESDVETEGDAITLRGEGECLVIFNFASSDLRDKPLAESWQRLIDAYDPGVEPADPTKIWAAIREKAGLP